VKGKLSNANPIKRLSNRFENRPRVIQSNKNKLKKKKVENISKNRLKSWKKLQSFNCIEVGVNTGGYTATVTDR